MTPIEAAKKLVPYVVSDFVRRRRAATVRRRLLGNLESITDVRRDIAGFDTMVDKVRGLGTSSISFFGNGYRVEGGLRLQQNPYEISALCLGLRRFGPFDTFLEIGCASGGTCSLLNQELGFRNTISLDDGKHPDASHQLKNLAHVKNLRRFVGDSHSKEAEEFLQQAVSGTIDVSLIDGDHSFDGVWADIQLVRKFSRPGTIFILHDTVACPDVGKAWFRCVSEKILSPIGEYIGETKALGIAVGRVI